jgi:flavin reductase (DIM6/NTAB) family NADH-FMN oxidoreductase RutF
MAAVPTSVVAIGGRADRDPVVMIIGSFASLSLDPMLVGFSVGRGSDRWRRLEHSDRFCVSVLSDDQAWISRRLGRPGEISLDGIGWFASPNGAIALTGAVAHVDVTPAAHYDAGDHFFVLCRVDHLEATGATNPLVYHDGQYCSVGPTPAGNETLA